MESINKISLDRVRMDPSKRLDANGPSTVTVYIWLSLYFACNLGLTIYNKAIMQFANFPYPWTVTAIHCFFSAIGSYLVVSTSSKRETINPEVNSLKGSAILISFSVLYTINIAISNVSLNLVNLAFHQLVRSTTPVFTVIICLVFGLKNFSNAIYVSLIPVVLGVALSTYGDMSYTMMGFFLTVLGTALAAIKTIVKTCLTLAATVMVRADESLFAVKLT